MTYDYHGHWDKRTGHVAPFYSHPDDEFFYFNTVTLFIFFIQDLNFIGYICCRTTQSTTGLSLEHLPLN